MEGDSANKPESTPKNTPPKPQQDDKEQYEIEFGNFKIRGPQQFISTLVIGLLAGGLLFYLAVFQIKKPQIVYRVLVEEPLIQTLAAMPSATPALPQIVEATREVTRIVPTVYVTKETVLVPTIMVTRVTEVVKETVLVPTIVVVTPTPTPFPAPNEILERDLKVAFECGAIVLRNLGGIDFQGWSDKMIKDRIRLQWQNANNKCEVIWLDFAQDRMISELTQILRQFREISRVEWKSDIPPGFQPPQTNNRYDLRGFRTDLQISGQYQCPGTSQMVTILGDENSLIFDSKQMTVEVQQLNDRIVIYNWTLQTSALDLLKQNCQ